MGKKILSLVMTELNDEGNVERDTSVTVYESDEASWDKFVPHFFHFLEGTGYLGVVERMCTIIGDIYEWESYHPEFKEE